MAAGLGRTGQRLDRAALRPKKLKPFILHADVIYSVPNEANIDGVKTRYANYLNYDFGMEYFKGGPDELDK
ncbi:MAG: hypothetical protein WC381_06410 [Kiritimatiellia bacterium]|jgi:hypothetical protein